MKRATSLELLPVEFFSGSYFTAPCRAWWGRDWQPYLKSDKSASQASRSAMQTRERRMAEGDASAAGTMVMPGTPKHLGPKPMMQRTHSEGGRQHGDKVSGYHFRGADSTARRVYALLQV